MLSGTVVDLSPLLFSQSNVHHFKKAAFDFVIEISVGFHSGNYYNVIRFPRIPVAVDWNTFYHPNLDYFHTGLDFTIHGFCCNVVMFQEVFLTICRCSTMTAHGWNDKRF